MIFLYIKVLFVRWCLSPLSYVKWFFSFSLFSQMFISTFNFSSCHQPLNIRKTCVMQLSALIVSARFTNHFTSNSTTTQDWNQTALITSRLLSNIRYTNDPVYVYQLYAQICWNLKCIFFFILLYNKFPDMRDEFCTKKKLCRLWFRNFSRREKFRLENFSSLYCCWKHEVCEL